MRPSLLSLITCLFSIALMWGQDDKKQEKNHELIPISQDIYMIKGEGGNIGVYIGKDGVFMIDDQYEHVIDDVLTTIRTLSDKPIKYLVNTHHHGDHTGGNSTMAKNGTTIFSHVNVRKKLIKGKKNDKNKLPVITFSDELTFYFNEEEIMTFHVHDAHTNGDALVFFTQSNVLHTGDTFFNGKYPYIDLNDGGSVQGVIDALKKVVMIVNQDTKIIPGHGKLASVKDIKITLAMMEDLYQKVKGLYKTGKSEDDVAQNKELTASYDQKGYGENWFITNEKMLRTIYRDLSAGSKK